MRREWSGNIRGYEIDIIENAHCVNIKWLGCDTFLQIKENGMVDLRNAMGSIHCPDVELDDEQEERIVESFLKKIRKEENYYSTDDSALFWFCIASI